MKFSKLSLAALVAFAMVSGTLLADDSFTYQGYMRIGSEWDTSLNRSTPFGLGGAQKWTGRLGNEQGTRINEDPFFLEQGFVKNWTMENGAWAKGKVLLNFHGKPTGDTADYLGDGTGTLRMRMREAYVEMGGLGFSPDMSFWIGKRFLNRDDIHTLDYFYLDMSGVGFGVANIAGIGLDLAMIQRARDTDDLNTSEDGYYTTNTYVAKFEQKLFRIDASYTMINENKGLGVDEGSGYFVSGTFKPEKFFYFMEGMARVNFQYAAGVSANNLWFGNRLGNVTGTGLDGWQNDEDSYKDDFAYGLHVFGLAQVNDQLAIMPALGYRAYECNRASSLTDPDNKQNEAAMYFAVIRAHYAIVTNLAAELEVGYAMGKGAAWGWMVEGWEDDGAGNWSPTAVRDADTKVEDYRGELKVTGAAVLGLDAGFWTRPQLRFYVTYKSLSGMEGKYAAVEEETSNTVFGTQVEAWW